MGHLCDSCVGSAIILLGSGIDWKKLFCREPKESHKGIKNGELSYHNGSSKVGAWEGRRMKECCSHSSRSGTCTINVIIIMICKIELESEGRS
jgi:hypothetical protein